MRSRALWDQYIWSITVSEGGKIFVDVFWQRKSILLFTVNVRVSMLRCSPIHVGDPTMRKKESLNKFSRWLVYASQNSRPRILFEKLLIMLNVDSIFFLHLTSEHILNYVITRYAQKYFFLSLTQLKVYKPSPRQLIP